MRLRGGSEHAPEQLVWMKGLHTAWLIGSSLEVWLLRRKTSARLAGAALLAFAAGHTLRQSAMRALGWRWTVRIMTVPKAPLVKHGPYQYLRHPNYLGVAIEIAALPLVHGAYLSAAVFGIANALLLRARIRAEEAALSRAVRT
jgi:methyltransferase